MPTLTIDSHAVRAAEGASLMQAAREAGLYIPGLCSHPDLEAAGVCGLCVVEVEGQPEPVLACRTVAAEGMVVHTGTARVQESRQQALARILATHPHACLTCAQREGCSRTQCSSNVPVHERCCSKFGRCEVQKVSGYIGIPPYTPRYVYRDLPVYRDEPLFDRDYNLCIGCQRCVRVCADVRGVQALEVSPEGDPVPVRARAATLAEAGCRFCTACVEVCPTGALLDKGLQAGERAEALVPCRTACPAGTDVPRYVRLIAGERYAEAAAVIREKLPFPGTLGRVCFHPCEDACRRGSLNQPVSICRLKRFADEHDDGAWRERGYRLPATGKRVAVVGSGPAGLTAAYYLAKKGHAVTVLEALPEPGGMLRVGIPRYRLPREVLEREIDEIRRAGVEIRVNSPVTSPADLEGYDAVCLAVGAHKPARLGVPGEDSSGVLDGVGFLRRLGLGEVPRVGERVAVVGGGNVAMDAARSALRLGAREIVILYRRTREEMPAYAEEVEEALAEGVQVEYLVAPTAITPAGGALHVTLTRMELGEPDASGRRSPVPVAGSEFTRTFDTVIAATGQQVDLPAALEVATGRGGVIQVNNALATGRPGFFAAGDAVSGPASVIAAIAQGRQAAASIDAYLGGDGNIDEVLVETAPAGPRLGRREGFAGLTRPGMGKRPWQKARRTGPLECCPPEELWVTAFAEVDLGFIDEDMAVDEADRCLRCELRLTISAAPLPPEQWLEFNPANVATVPEAEGVFRLLDAEHEVLQITGTPNLRRALEEKLANPGEARYFDFEEDSMYTKRESELIQEYLQEHGRLPQGGNDDLDDLF